MTDKVEDELHAIIFMCKTDRARYGRLNEEKENNILEGNDPFQKTVVDACRVLAGWKN